MESFIKMHRELPEWIEKYPEAFHLLSYIARRARRNTGETTYRNEVIALGPGEFIIGRKKASEDLGITEGKYRQAYKALERSKQIKTIKTTNRYTVGLLCSNNIFDINIEVKSPTEYPTNNHQTTTNKNDKKKKKEFFQNSNEEYSTDEIKNFSNTELLNLTNNWQENGSDQKLFMEASRRGLL